MTIGESVETCFKKYAVFKGRASRSEFWYFFLFNTIVSLVTTLVFLLLIFLLGEERWMILPSLLLMIYNFVIILPSSAVYVRRLHDVGVSGWWYLVYVVLSVLGGVCQICNISIASVLMFITILMGIFMFIFTLMKGGKGENKYGPMPE